MLNRFIAVRKGILYGDRDTPRPSLSALHMRGYTFAEMSPRRLACDPFIASRAKTNVFVARCEGGHRCFAFTDAAGTTAAYAWYTIARAAPVAVPWELGQCAMIPPYTAYIWDCFTNSGHRRHGLYRALLFRLRILGRDEGARECSMVARASNEASRAGIIAAGFTPQGTYATIRVGPLVVIARRSGVPIILKSPGQFLLVAPANRPEAARAYPGTQ